MKRTSLWSETTHSGYLDSTIYLGAEAALPLRGSGLFAVGRQERDESGTPPALNPAEP
jgi:hypothetical protein